jgi:glutathione S-transferase
MTRQELLDKLARAIAENEGFFVTEAQARARNIRFPTRAQINANPGNLRAWRDAKGRPYPTSGGYVDFVAWASERSPGAAREEMSRRAMEEGWRILRVLAGQYIDGRYTGGKAPTIEEMFCTYAPASDGNDPVGYARSVAGKLGAQPDQRLVDLVTA